MLVIKPEYFLLIARVCRIYHILSNLLSLPPLYTPPYNYTHAEVPRQKQASPPVPEDQGRHFEAIDKQPELQEGFEDTVGLVFPHNKHWSYSIPILEAILNEALPVLNPYTHLPSGGDSCLFKTTRDQAYALSLLHQSLHVGSVNRLHSPYPEKSPCDRSVQHCPTHQVSDVGQLVLWVNVQSSQHSKCQYTVRVGSKGGFFVIRYDLLMDDLELSEVPVRLQDLVDERDVAFPLAKVQLNDLENNETRYDPYVDGDYAIDKQAQSSVDHDLQEEEVGSASCNLELPQSRGCI